jgi:hypothetical protein
LTFKRAVMVDTWADLNIGLEAEAVRAASGWMKTGLVAGLVVLFGTGLAIGQRRPREKN